MTYTAKYTPCNGHTPATIIGTVRTQSGARMSCRDHFHREHAETRNTEDRDVFAAYHFDRGQLYNWNDNDPIAVIGTNGYLHQYTITPEGNTP